MSALQPMAQYHQSLRCRALCCVYHQIFPFISLLHKSLQVLGPLTYPPKRTLCTHMHAPTPAPTRTCSPTPPPACTRSHPCPHLHARPHTHTCTCHAYASV